MIWTAAIWDGALLWLCYYLWRREKRIHPNCVLQFSIADSLVATMGLALMLFLHVPFLDSYNGRDRELGWFWLVLLTPHQFAGCFIFRLESIWPGVSKATSLESNLYVLTGLLVGLFLPLVSGIILVGVALTAFLLPFVLPIMIIVEVVYALARKSRADEAATREKNI